MAGNKWNILLNNLKTALAVLIIIGGLITAFVTARYEISAISEDVDKHETRIRAVENAQIAQKKDIEYIKKGVDEIKETIKKDDD